MDWSGVLSSSLSLIAVAVLGGIFRAVWIISKGVAEGQADMRAFRVQLGEMSNKISHLEASIANMQKDVNQIAVFQSQLTGSKERHDVLEKRLGIMEERIMAIFQRFLNAKHG